jgi:hypothetical protein
MGCGRPQLIQRDAGRVSTAAPALLLHSSARWWFASRDPTSSIGKSSGCGWRSDAANDTPARRMLPVQRGVRPAVLHLHVASSRSVAARFTLLSIREIVASRMPARALLAWPCRARARAVHERSACTRRRLCLPHHGLDPRTPRSEDTLALVLICRHEVHDKSAVALRPYVMLHGCGHGPLRAAPERAAERRGRACRNDDALIGAGASSSAKSPMSLRVKQETP